MHRGLSRNSMSTPSPVPQEEINLLFNPNKENVFKYAFQSYPVLR